MLFLRVVLECGLYLRAGNNRSFTVCVGPLIELTWSQENELVVIIGVENAKLFIPQIFFAEINVRLRTEGIEARGGRCG